jgi:hypothetical protein
MNIIFITVSNINSIKERGIYADLMRKLRDEGHQVHIVSPIERKFGQETHVIDTDGVKILKIRTLNIQKTNIVEKGVGTLLIERQYIKAIKKYLSGVSFDLITYSTPPITFTNVVRYLKKQNPQAVSYLLLKDIFPQNAVDLGMLVASPKPSPEGKGLEAAVKDVPEQSKPSPEGKGLEAAVKDVPDQSKPSPEGKGFMARLMNVPKYWLYRFFRNKEKKLYKVSDYIGCMSPANVEFLLKHNDYIDRSRVEVAPNSIELQNTDETDITDEGELELKHKNEKIYIRKKYNLPTHLPIFVYGGNLGKPQGIDYLIKCLDANKLRQDCYFVVVGNGTEYGKLEAWYSNLNVNANPNVKLMQRLPKEDYDMLVRSCDVGLIFLDHRFTIPNYPSRLLSYLENKMPVVCATDVNTDIGRIAEENGYGYWCESVKPEDFTALVDKMLASDRKAMGEKGYQFLKENYLVEHTYNAIMSHFNIEKHGGH